MPTGFTRSPVKSIRNNAVAASRNQFVRSEQEPLHFARSKADLASADHHNASRAASRHNPTPSTVPTGAPAPEHQTALSSLQFLSAVATFAIGPDILPLPNGPVFKRSCWL